jgi:ABC-2 type transport system permease protein
MAVRSSFSDAWAQMVMVTSIAHQIVINSGFALDNPGRDGYVFRFVRRLLTAHVLLVAAGFQEQSRYRLATLGGLVANATFGLLKVAILFATVEAAGGELAGYDAATMSAYVWISQGMLGSVNLMGRVDIAERIRTGDVTVDFLRPLDVHTAMIAHELGRSLFSLVPRGVPSVLIGALLVGMAFPDSPAAYLLGAVSLLLAMMLSAATVYLVAAAGFWFVETRGLQLLYMVVAGFFAGLFVPLWLFPVWLQGLALATPFPALLMFPTDILSGRTTGLDAVGLVGAQLLWFAGVVTVGQLVTRAGRRHLEVQGG